MHGRRSALRVATVAGVVTGVVAGSPLGLLTDVGTARQDSAQSPPWIEATHLPPLLTDAGEPVELRFDAYCHAGEDDDVDEPCVVAGAVHVRRGNAGAFAEIAVAEETGAPEGRLLARVPPAIARDAAGFSYYAVLRDVRSGATTTIPAGGGEAPHISRPLVRPTEIALGVHRFGAVRRASERVASARWGSGAGEVGLEPGRQLMPAGGSSFAVGANGAVHVLDQANRRLLTWDRTGGTPAGLPLAVNGTLADLAVADDGTRYVLETTAPRGEPAVVRAFDRDGRSLGATPLAERASHLRTEHGTVRALEQPSGQWMEVFADERPATRSRQERTGRAGRQTEGGEELLVLRAGNEVRVALARGHTLWRSWRVTSSSALGEVQLAELAGRSLVLVLRVYTDAKSEFRALVLAERGVTQSFSVPASDWAETAPLSRFRVSGSSLYQLGSTPEGVFVDRYDLEVER